VLPGCELLFNPPEHFFGEFRRLLERALRAVLFLSIPAALFLAVFKHSVIHLIYERGAFDPESTKVTANLLAFYAMGSVLFILNNLFVHAFYARREMAVRVWYGALQLLVFVATAALLVQFLGVRGLALAHVAAAIAGALLLALLLRQRQAISLRTLLRAGALYLAVSLVAVGSGWLVGQGLGVWPRGDTGFFVAAAVSISVFLVLAYALRIAELHYVVDLAFRVVKRWKA